MSNVIKPVYFNVDRVNKKVIENDSAVKDRFDNAVNNDLPEGFDFVPGINVINIDEIIEEQKNNVMDNVSELVDKAKKEAEDIIDEAKQAAETIRQEAYNDGFNQGAEAGRESAVREIDQIKQQYKNQETALQAEYEKIVNEIEPQFAEIVGSLVEKVTGVLVENTDVFHYLIDRTIKELPVSGKYIIHVGTDDFAAVDSYKAQFETLVPNGASVEILEDVSLDKNKCIVETETHMIDSSIDVQLNNLKRDLRLLSIS